MKRNDFREIKTLDIAGLISKAKALKLEIADLVLDINMNKVKDLKSAGKKRKDLAQVLTVLKQKQLLESLEARIKSQELVIAPARASLISKRSEKSADEKPGDSSPAEPDQNDKKAKKEKKGAKK